MDALLKGRGGRTQASPDTPELDWDRDDDEVSLDACVPNVYTSPLCLYMHIAVAQLLGLPLKGISQRVIVWQQMPRLRFETEIWPSQKCVSINVETDASEFAWGKHPLCGPLLTAREYFTWEESVESSTFGELLGDLRYFQTLVHISIGTCVVVQVDAKNLLGIVDRGGTKLAIKKLARDLF
jgi:hypothetical protein